MTFDAGTWWLIAAAAAALVGAVSFLIKRTVFARIDKCEEKMEHFITKTAHEKDLGECKSDIRQIKEDYITKEDFFREQSKTDRKLDRIMDILLEMKGSGHNERT